MSGRWWRQLPAGGDPLWRPVDAPDGRWQRGATVEGYYLADSPDTAWAEWYRSLAELGLPPHRALPRDLWALDLDVTVADLSTVNRLAAIGLTPPRPGRAGWAAYQAVGETIAADGWAGLVAPSAARPAHLAVCLFRRDGDLAGVAPVAPPQRLERAPVPPRGMTT